MTVIRKIILNLGSYLLLCFIMMPPISQSMEFVQREEIQHSQQKDLYSLYDVSPDHSPNMGPLLPEAIMHITTFLPHRDLVSFSQSNQENRKLCFSSKLKYFISVFLLPDPGKDAYFVAKYLKKIALAERFIYSLIPIDAPKSYKDQIQIYKNNNESTKKGVLKIAKDMRYSLSFQLMSGPLYLTEITDRQNLYTKPAPVYHSLMLLLFLSILEFYF